MGFRTVVMLNNDQAREWENDPELGKKIARAMHAANRIDPTNEAEVGNYGRVVQCVHADSQTLAVLDGYTHFHHLSGKTWVKAESKEDIVLKLLNDAAAKFGYQLVKQA